MSYTHWSVRLSVAVLIALSVAGCCRKQASTQTVVTKNAPSPIDVPDWAGRAQDGRLDVEGEFRRMLKGFNVAPPIPSAAAVVAEGTPDIVAAPIASSGLPPLPDPVGGVAPIPQPAPQPSAAATRRPAGAVRAVYPLVQAQVGAVLAPVRPEISRTAGAGALEFRFAESTPAPAWLAIDRGTGAISSGGVPVPRGAALVGLLVETFVDGVKAGQSSVAVTRAGS